MGLFKDFYSTGGASFSALSEMKQFMNHRGPAIESVSLALSRRSSRWKKGQRNPRTLGTVANSNEAAMLALMTSLPFFRQKKFFSSQKVDLDSRTKFTASLLCPTRKQRQNTLSKFLIFLSQE